MPFLHSFGFVDLSLASLWVFTIFLVMAWSEYRNWCICQLFYGKVNMNICSMNTLVGIYILTASLINVNASICLFLFILFISIILVEIKVIFYYYLIIVVIFLTTNIQDTFSSKHCVNCLFLQIEKNSYPIFCNWNAIFLEMILVLC